MATKYIPPPPFDGNRTDGGPMLAHDMTLRDWFAGTAPPVPAVAAEAYLECLKTNDPKDMRIPWNDDILERLAIQEARWRKHYANAMLAARQKVK